MSAPPPDPAPDAPALHRAVLPWYERNARDLPWRSPAAGAWGVLVSEVMLQQTPVARVEPVWRAWMHRWPEPADLAAESPAEVLRAWGRLGYPRRALRLQECARVITQRHGGQVPRSAAELLALPGVGSYTAAAVGAFAHGRRTVVLDTNVRRVLARAVHGRALPGPSLTRAEERLAESLVPRDDDAAARWNVAVMELGALVCTARAPRCPACPLLGQCSWVAAGSPPDELAGRRRTQSWHGSDRQARGRVLAALRAARGPVPATDLLAAARGSGTTDAAQPQRALDSLVADGLVQDAGGDRYDLPQA